MARPFAINFYTSSKWRDARDAALARDDYLCQRCLAEGRVTAAEIVHHKHELTPDNIQDDRIAYGLDNLVSLCRLCHAEVHGLRVNREAAEERKALRAKRHPVFDDTGALVGYK